jgi:hypothetical protein
VWDDDHLMFAELRSPGTVENLRYNPVVEVNVVEPFLRKGYRFRGRAEVLTEGRSSRRPCGSSGRERRGGTAR